MSKNKIPDDWTILVSGEYQAEHEHEWVDKTLGDTAEWKSCQCGADAFPSNYFELAKKAN